jgi:hypothetical protein
MLERRRFDEPWRIRNTERANQSCPMPSVEATGRVTLGLSEFARSRRECIDRQLHSLTSIVFDEMPPFLCRLAPLAQLIVTLSKTMQRARCNRATPSSPSRNNIIRDFSRRLTSSPTARNTARDRSHRCLSRHNSAFAERKSAARSSRPGPV